jgi:hypothetical protein
MDASADRTGPASNMNGTVVALWYLEMEDGRASARPRDLKSSCRGEEMAAVDEVVKRSLRLKIENRD